MGIKKSLSALGYEKRSNLGRCSLIIMLYGNYEFYIGIVSKHIAGILNVKSPYFTS